VATEAPTDEEPRPEDGDHRPNRVRTFVLWAAKVGVAVFVAIQFVPYGWSHSNPPVVQNAPWPNAESEAIARESCYSCHSNETDWPLYSYVAPMSWLVRRDVDRGRNELNFSRWDRDADEADDAIEMVEEGRMPPSQYTLIHRDAKLTDDEITVLVAALKAMAEDEVEDEGDGDGDNSGPGGGDG
jgi:Haem-binding domain